MSALLSRFKSALHLIVTRLGVSTSCLAIAIAILSSFLRRLFALYPSTSLFLSFLPSPNYVGYIVLLSLMDIELIARFVTAKCCAMGEQPDLHNNNYPALNRWSFALRSVSLFSHCSASSG
jgi:hypothetical protein